jgi:ring-1,2-phenylacetyl-CoA epoxidase subunit PaaC
VIRGVYRHQVRVLDGDQPREKGDMVHEETVYDALTAAHGDEAHWAFGTGFDDPLAGVDTTVPDGVDPADLGTYCLMLGDDALVLSQRLTEWITAAPELEEEVALANIALDLLGQARLLLARAGSTGVLGRSRERAADAIPDEDALAYFRDADEFRCTALVAAPGGDFARTVLRLLAASTWRLGLFTRLRTSRDPVLAAVATKGMAELTYHRDHAARWVVRLGDGTPESHRRAQAGAGAVWPLLDDVFTATGVERRLADAGVAVDPAALQEEVRGVLTEVLTRATLVVPPWPGWSAPRGREGRHGPEVAELLSVLQGLARRHPAATW